VPFHRRDLLKGGLAAGTLLLLDSNPVLSASLVAARGQGAERRSPLFPGVRLVHADLHNHSHLSDGTGDPFAFHAMLRGEGIDVAALTDHAVAGFGRRDLCAPIPDVVGVENPCRALLGMTDAGWQTTHDLANAANAPGRYAALPGFEWTSPHLGHMNVWFSEEWIDPLRTGGVTAEGLAQIGLSVELLEALLRTEFGELLTDAEITEVITAIRDQEPAGMRLFYDWLLRQPRTAGLGGGGDGLVGFNHPNREPAVFDDFAFDERIADRMVTLELFNRRDDYLFRGLADGMPSPLVACLNAGWRVGIVGTTDEHGTQWGTEQGKGRAGVWLRGLQRRGVREALLGRRVFATREPGLRLAATADGVPMGCTIAARRGRVEFALDLDLGPDRAGLPVTVQVLRPGTEVPEVADVVAGEAARPGSRPLRFGVPLDPDDGDWIVLRIADPLTANDTPAPVDHPCNDRALAYASPWWFGDARPGHGHGPTTRPPRGRSTPDEPRWWVHRH
jgi:hypothetical protein